MIQLGYVTNRVTAVDIQLMYDLLLCAPITDVTQSMLKQDFCDPIERHDWYFWLLIAIYILRYTWPKYHENQ